MTINRRGIADEVDRLDEEIAELQRQKRECFAAYSAQLGTQGLDKDQVKLQVVALKAAIKRRRAYRDDEHGAGKREDLIDVVFDEIRRSPRGDGNGPGGGEIVAHMEANIDRAVADGNLTRTGEREYAFVEAGTPAPARPP